MGQNWGKKSEQIFIHGEAHGLRVYPTHKNPRTRSTFKMQVAQCA
jgi:hypothetical protein